jgi:hypothetical protein
MTNGGRLTFSVPSTALACGGGPHPDDTLVAVQKTKVDTVNTVNTAVNTRGVRKLSRNSGWGGGMRGCARDHEGHSDDGG